MDSSKDPKAPAEDAVSIVEKGRKDRVVSFVLRGIFLSVLQHVVALQSDIKLFSNALNGDQAAVARSLAFTTASSGLAGLFINQIGGKLSDAFGRKPGFLLGPFLTISSVVALLTHHKNIAVLMACKLVRSMSITFSGTVMSTATLSDMLEGPEMAVVGTKIGACIGVAVILGPFVESLLLKLSRGDPRGPFRAMAGIAALQLCTVASRVPETLSPAKRKPMGEFSALMQSLNPFAFMKVYFGKNVVLQKLLTIQTFQMCSDGKCTSDLLQLWARNPLTLSDETLRNFIALWGFAVCFASAVVHPSLLKRLSTLQFSTVTNLCIWLGLSIHGIAPSTAYMYAGLPVLLPGVNGANAHAIKSLASKLAEAEGYGNGEWSAWSTNLRTIAQSINIICIGTWYARCQDRGIYPGSAWWLAGFVAGGLPQLLMLTMKAEEFEPPVKKEELVTKEAPVTKED